MTDNGQRTTDAQQIAGIEQANQIVEVAVELGVKIRGNLGACFRRERHAGQDEPTLFFNVARNSFLCKQCEDVGGGVIEFVSQYKGWQRQQAIDWLVHRMAFDQETRKKYYTKGKKKG